jgi:hypothetical protein
LKINLPVEEKKCTEHAHNKADTYFDYTITYCEDNIVKERFTSHYTPWQEIYLIGIEKLNEKSIATTSLKIIK